MKNVSSLVQAMQPTKFPDVVFYVTGSNDDEIRRLTNLRMSEDSLSFCGCYEILGDEEIKDGKTKHVNTLRASASECYTTFVLAQEAITLSKLRSKKRDFERTFNGDTRLRQTSRIKSYPDLVFTIFKENDCLPEGVVTVDDMKASHYREMVNERELYSILVKRIVDTEFPTLADDEEDEQDF